jgi:hypothetical protein
MKRSILATGVALAGIACAFAGGAPAAQRACEPGVTTIKGFQARVFCGPATAKGTINGKPFVFSGGVCDRHPQYLVVNIGTVVLGIGKNKPRLPYFGLLMGKSPAASASDPVVARDGTYTKGLITIGTSKSEVDLHDETDLKITLTHGRRSGTFSATKPGSTLFNVPTRKVSGSFRC